MTVWRFFGLAALLLALLLAVLISFASTWLRLGLSVYNIEDVAFTSLDIGLSKAELTGLKIGNPVSQEVDAISVDYSLSMLMSGQVDRIRITGLHADLDFDEILQDGSPSYEDSPPALSPLGALADELIVEKSRINLDTPFGIVTIPFTGHIETQEDRIDFQVTSDQANQEEVHGDVNIALDLFGTMPLSQPPALDLIEASGEVSIQIADAALPKLGEDLDGGGLIAIVIKDGKLEASSEALNFVIEHPISGEPLDGPLTAKAGNAGKPFYLTGQQEGDLWHLDVNGPLEMTAASGQGLADFDVQLALDHEGKLQRLEGGKIGVDFKDLKTDQVSLSAANIDLEISGDVEALEGHVTLALVGFHWSNNQYRLQDLSLDQTLAVKIENEVLTLLIEEQGRASIGQLAAIDQVESGWFTVRFHQDDTPVLRLDAKNDSWHHQLYLEIDPARIETSSGQWWARVEDLDLSAEGDPGGVKSGKISIRQGRADWPGSNLALAGIESELHLMESSALSDRTIPLAIRSMRPLEEPELFAPFRLDAALSLSADSSTVKGQLTSRANPDIAVDFSGSYEPPDDKARLSFDLPDLRFFETGLQPSDLSPMLQDVVEDASGRMALTGSMTWEAGELTSSMDLLIEELGLSIGPARLERVNTLFHFDSLIPPTTPVDQELAIALLDVGLPLTDGFVSMQLKPDGELAVNQLSWRLADGDVRAAPFTFGSDVQDLTMVLDVDQLDLNELLELTELDGLSGEGRIDGTLPLIISENGVIVADGKLEATDAGILRYRPDETPSALKAGGESIGLVLQALEDFRYDDLDISLNGRTDGETDIKLHLRGANPDLYDGYPIEFNLDLEGDLTNLIRANLSNYQIPNRIRERLQGFGR